MASQKKEKDSKNKKITDFFNSSINKRQSELSDLSSPDLEFNKSHKKLYLPKTSGLLQSILNL